MQVVGYDVGYSDEDMASGEEAGEPSLLVAENGVVEREPLPTGRDLSYTLGDRHCAGTVDGDDHYGCDNETAPYCDVHRSRWPCARCTGDCDRPIEACREEHAIYLAAFAPSTFKVGVTRSWRLERRLREQGADRAAHVRTVVDGRVARQLEAEIAERITDRVRVPEKVRGFHRAVDEDAWEALLDEFDPISRFDFDYGFSLDARPVMETLASGTVRGTKGRVLVLDRETGTYAVDMRELVGHELVSGRSERDLQSSLGSFGQGN